MNSALDGSHRTFADFRRLLIREARHAHQNEGLPLVERQPGERLEQLPEFQSTGLCRWRCQLRGVAAVRVRNFPAPLAPFREEHVPQDRDQPGDHRAGPECVHVRQGAQQRLLDEIVGTVDVAAQRNGECAKSGYGCKHHVAQQSLSAVELWSQCRTKDGSTHSPGHSKHTAVCRRQMLSFHVASPSPDMLRNMLRSETKDARTGAWLKILEKQPNALRWRLDSIDPAPLWRTSRGQSRAGGPGGELRRKGLPKLIFSSSHCVFLPTPHV